MFHQIPTTHSDGIASTLHSSLQTDNENSQTESFPRAPLATLDPYPELRMLLTALPARLSSVIQERLLTPDPYQDLRLQVLDEIADKDSTVRDVRRIADQEQLSFLLRHESVFALIEGMLLDSERYRRELAFFFNQVPVQYFPLHLQHVFPSSPLLPLSVIPYYSDWSLCSAAEERLQRAMDDQGVLLVNNTILLKFYGKLSGLALRTTRLADGMQLIAGCWYAPVDHRDQIRDAFDRGESTLWMEEGQWVFLRALDENEDDTRLWEAQSYAATLPERLPEQIGEGTRKEYRASQHEGF